MLCGSVADMKMCWAPRFIGAAAVVTPREEGIINLGPLAYAGMACATSFLTAPKS